MKKRKFNPNRIRREYHLIPTKTKPQKRVTIRISVVNLYRVVKERYKSIRLHKQFYKVMELARDNNQIITAAELVCIFKPQITTAQPTKEEMTRLRQIVYYFRKEYGALSGILAYQFKLDLNKGNGAEPVFRPIKNKQDYMQIVGRHLVNVGQSELDRHKENLALLRKTPKQIEKIIDEASLEIDQEVEGF